MPLYGQWSGSPRRFNALRCFNVRLDSPAPGAIYMPIMLLRNARPRPNGFNTTTRKDAQYCSSKCRLRAFRNEGGGAP
jgi:hypothetical protein